MTTTVPDPQAPVAGSPEWINKQVGELQADATEQTPAPPDPLEATLPENFPHGFFKGKPLKEFYNSYKATEAEMQRAQRDARDSRELAERYRAESVAKDVALQMAAERTPQPPVDEFEVFEKKLFEDPKGAARLLYDKALKDAESKFGEQNRQSRAETVQEVSNRDRQQKFVAAMSDARQRMGNIDDHTWNKRAKAVVQELTDPQSKYYGDGATQGPFIAQNWVEAYNELYPQQQAPAVSPVPQAGNPPGAHKATTVSASGNGGLPTLEKEKRAALTMIATRLGFDPEAYISRYQRELAKANG